MNTIIEVNHLKKYYNDVKAVDDISFTIEQGEFFGFLGVNGAGKSTTINMLCTLLSPTGGSANICGYKLGEEDEEIRKRIGVVYQTNCLDEILTVKENLLVRGSLYEKSTDKLKKNLQNVSDLLSLDNIMNRPFRKLSGGQKRRCEIARALMNTPSILFLDEPTTGLDPATRKNVWNCLEVLRKELNMTIFLTTHYMEEASCASHIAIIDSGKIKQYGTPFSLKETFAKDILRLIPNNEEVLLSYLDGQDMHWSKQEDRIVIKLENTTQALPVLDDMRSNISGFEVIQGSMDDVFLNVTGKTLES